MDDDGEGEEEHYRRVLTELQGALSDSGEAKTETNCLEALPGDGEGKAHKVQLCASAHSGGRYDLSSL